MPTLHWIGKEKVINHHMDVPFKVLEHSYGFDNGKQTKTETQSGNKIIHGDNLEALKALLPEYEGKIKCIYIDPPYNTGNEGWVYNDNVNDPKIKKWLEKVVGKEGEDLSRHDKWLCMMYPRLKLLHKLLADDGAIFISLDDNEQAHLRLICDEIFGAGNFINNVIWQKKYSPQNDARYFSDMHDFVITYSKSKNAWERNLLPRTEAQNKRYKNVDNDPRGSWKPSDLSVKTYNENADYPITTPSGRIVNPPNGRCWGVSKDKFRELVDDNRIWFGTNGSNVPSLKKFVTDVQSGTVPLTLWLREEVGDNQEAKQVLKQIFNDGSFPFDTPKPSRLIERVLQIATNKDDLILDSFAGSGTTAHAVLNLNKQDGGNRQFICIEMEDYAETITAERVKRVIKGYGEDKKAVAGTGGSFDFYQLGQPLFDEEGNLNESVGLAKIRNYVWYTETKTSLVEEKHEDNPHFLGKHIDTSYYFNYEAEAVTTLDHSFLASMKTKAEQYVIYADNCLLTKAFMVKHHIIFKKIPRDITKF
ncbi:type III restriction endonuclease subunit M [Roseivirga seohaensis]|uniref:site-specific DNA-methyltransferase (adenine-specific) n=1 Tax=Roseivirga seohaensis TaxID=1914963 RepID=A0A150XWM1_9BACT|nr:site-specific DNA-methyltransferase [Roseivirga seohaensis]KYG83025.1 type III restriction endonuclease subunit M [Roseivirga seohaensis]